MTLILHRIPQRRSTKILKSHQAQHSGVMFPLLQVPGRVFELHPVVQGPSGIDGLLGDKAMAATTCVLVHPVHAAFVHPASLVVVVRSNTVIGTASEKHERGVFNCQIQPINPNSSQYNVV